MELEHVSLLRQMDMMFWELHDELIQLSSGTVFVQIRNNMIGKFGVKHIPIESREGKFNNVPHRLSEAQLASFRKMAIEALTYKHHWTHGEILFDFTLRNHILCTSVQFESNYNMVNLTQKTGK